jgi:predicted TIM-barrel fold metal-dependent hydrolase
LWREGTLTKLKTNSAIIDAHHHIWRLSDLAWLNGPTQPRVFGDYDLLKRDYLIQEFIEDAIATGVIASVYIQVNWPHGEEVAEATWVQEVADHFGWPNAIVGYVDFSSENCADTLSALAKLPLMRGIRQQLHWHKNPLYRFAPEPNIMRGSKWRYNFALLQDYDWTFELQIFASQMRHAAKLAEEFKQTPMILQHCGMPEDASTIGMASWLEGMKFLAEQPNVYCKFSGLGTFLHKTSINFITDITANCLELFGPSRCVYGSNFPIEKLWTSYSDLVGCFSKSLSSLSELEQRLIFHSNAEKLYKINI